DDGKEDDDDDDQDDAERDDDDDEEEIAKIDEPEDTESGEDDVEETESDEESAKEETREEEEESSDLIPRTPKDSKDDDKGEEDQGLRVSEEQRLIEEEEADELYRDVDINQGMGLHVSQDIEDSHVTLTPVHLDGQQESSSVSSFVTSMLNPISDAGVESIFTTASSSQMHEAVRVVVQIQTDRLHESYQRENDEFLKTIDDNMKRIIKEQMEGNKSIQRSDKQRNLYKDLVEAYEADKTILESYGDTAILKRRRKDDDDQEGPFAGSDRGSKRRREGREPESASTPSESATRSASRSTTGTQSRQMSASEYAFAEETVQTTCQMDEPSHPVFETAVQGSAQTWISELVKQANSRSSFNELLDTPIDFSNFIMNRICVDTLTPELLAGPTYELMRGSCNSLTDLEYHLEEVYKATTDQLDCVNPEGVSQWGQKRQQFYGFAVNWESALDVYSKRRIIAVTDLKIVEWHNYKHLDWISIRRDDDKIYTFKEGDLKRLRLQDIKDILLPLVQGKLSNLTVEERFDFNVSLRMFTWSIVIQRRMEDLQLGVESY
nr:hypothetical protein [Tanacetum cinerariifolium]